MHILKGLIVTYSFRIYYNTVYKIKKGVFIFTQIVPIIFFIVLFTTYLKSGTYNNDQAIFWIFSIVFLNIIDILFFNYRRIPISYYMSVKALNNNKSMFSVLVYFLNLVIHGILYCLIFIFLSDIDVKSILGYSLFIIIFLLEIYSLKNFELNKSNVFAINIIYTISIVIVLSTVFQLFKLMFYSEGTVIAILLIGLYWIVYIIANYVYKVEEYSGLCFKNVTMNSISFDLSHHTPNCVLVEYDKEIENGITVVVPNTNLWHILYVLFYKNGHNIIMEGEIKCTNKFVNVDLNSFNNHKLLLGKAISKFDFITKMILSNNSLAILNISLDDLTETEIEGLVEISNKNRVIILGENERLVSRSEVI